MKRTLSIRSGFTLMELILALALTVLLMGGLYVTVDVHLKLAQAGRESVERTTLSRALFRRMSDDIVSSVTLSDPGRFRREDPNSANAEAAESEDPTLEDPEAIPTNLIFPLGVIGDTSTMHLFTSRLPKEVYQSLQSDDEERVIASDLRRISYWLAGDLDAPLGLARQELTLAATEDAINLVLPEIDAESSYVLAPEVRTVSFSYFDGFDWLESWDSTLPGDDGATPIGPPRAIAIVLGFAKPGDDPGDIVDEDRLDYHRHVVAIVTANGDTQVEDLSEDLLP